MGFTSARCSIGIICSTPVGTFKSPIVISKCSALGECVPALSLYRFFYYSVLAHSNTFHQNTDSKIHISKPYINLLTGWARAPRRGKWLSLQKKKSGAPRATTSAVACGVWVGGGTSTAARASSAATPSRGQTGRRSAWWRGLIGPA